MNNIVKSKVSKKFDLTTLFSPSMHSLAFMMFSRLDILITTITIGRAGNKIQQCGMDKNEKCLQFFVKNMRLLWQLEANFTISRKYFCLCDISF